jgi:hypothetical protein
VNDISIDKFGDTVASCSDDGKVMIRSLYNDTSQMMSFDRPIKAVAIDPEFSKSKKRQFVIGGLAGELILSEKGWFGNTTKRVLHSEEGSVAWRARLSILVSMATPCCHSFVGVRGCCRVGIGAWCGYLWVC